MKKRFPILENAFFDSLPKQGFLVLHHSGMRAVQKGKRVFSGNFRSFYTLQLIAGLGDQFPQVRVGNIGFGQDHRFSVTVGRGYLFDAAGGADDVVDMRFTHSAQHAGNG